MNIFLQKNSLSANFLPFFSHLTSKNNINNNKEGKISDESKENPASVGFDKMYMDIGACDKKEAEGSVQIGDMAAYSGNFQLIGGKIMAKALDDRSGCWALVRAMQNAKNSPNDIYAVFTVQEEVGLRGAKTSSNLINPDMAIAIDVSNVGDTPESTEINLRLGKGPGIKLKDASFIIHESVKKLLLNGAKESGIPYQLEAANIGGTDAGAIHLSGSGIASGTISIPTRYIHSASEVIDKSDLENTVKLLEKIMDKDICDYLM